MRRARWLVAVALLGAAGVWLGLRLLENAWLHQPIAAITGPVVFDVAAGSSLQKVADDLARRGLLDRAWFWVRHARRTGAATRIQAGEYEILPGTTPAALLDKLVAGDVRLYALTIPEGWTIAQALAAVHAQPELTAELKGLEERVWMARLGLAGRHPEGLFFPDTYRFPRGTTDRELLVLAHRRLQRELESAWSRRSPKLPLDDPYQALVLASLVEKETGAPDERPLIAGVFANRLRLGMRLQTDPSVIYGLGAGFDGDLRRRDLERDTPYNSYTRAGLPPTPIALVGRAALEAAVRPAETDALYFVATGRGDGRHYFARTLVAHNENVVRHLDNLRRGTGVQVR